MSFIEFYSLYKEEHPCSTVFLSANKYIRKMKGGSQSILVQCDDNRFYVVKMAGNPQGPNVVANEFLGSVIAGAVGLPVAESMLIHLSDHFIDSDPDIWFELPSERKRPDAGLHFGSLPVGQPWSTTAIRAHQSLENQLHYKS
ncbi:HipA family kinase [Tunturiibacter gelidoferens]|uniref:HipA-like kinase domain-containing protein n=1 Tax=Tunturiibacter gelidiferens TaxID=3069689 RepID=A0AAU7Z084_9BACT